MKLINITLTDADIKDIAADNDIPEEEWTFAIQRVLSHREALVKNLQASLMRQAEAVVLGIKLS